MNKNLSEGDSIGNAEVVKRYFSGLGVETAVLEPEYQSFTNEGHLIAEMSQLGWTYHFTRDSTGKMFFRDADNWTMEPGAGNS